ncbi:hypothetical protein [uncultured Paraglaciecola sp.]|uniref:hypothetical protein n=1 Tax=uncultured Paraglaciecola sp. TaxID=1765024 RepID=UPI0030D6DE58|tara:strand:+ start:178854 stop:179981 length:1128 start_codon:yes stop_codon:yes gene_type:complete
MNKWFVVYSLGVLKQKGAAILLTVVLLLIMVTLVTLYTGKIQSFEQQILLNTQNQIWANASAKAGLNQGLAILNVNKVWPNIEVTGNLEDNSTFSLSAISENLPGRRTLVTMTANGRSADGLARATVEEQSLVYPILFNTPPAPLMVQHGISNDGEFEIVSNPDGLGVSAPFSLWSDTEVTLSGTHHHSCTYSAFSEGNCSTNSYSDHSIKMADIMDASASFPADVVSYLFNIPATEWLQLQQQADFVLADCDSLDIGSWGLIWINGNCDVSASTQVGSESEPIILVIYDGDLEFHPDVAMYGLLLSFKPLGSLKNLDINMQTGSAVFGAVVSNYQLGTKSELARVVFNTDVMEQLQHSKKLQRVARVPGSWHDF